MPGYHSVYNDSKDVYLLGNMALLPFTTQFGGPAQQYGSLSPDTKQDIIDECLLYYRANCLFKNFDIQGPADRLLLYGELFIGDCLAKIAAQQSRAVDSKSANSMLQQFALDCNTIPGSTNFPLNAIYQIPENRQDQELMKQYLAQFRQELAHRLLSNHLYPVNSQTKTASKWWLGFHRRRFMGKSLVAA